MTRDTQRSPRAISVADADSMKQLGAGLGRMLQLGDVVALVGPLGAGKTTFVQGLAEGLGVPAERHVASPTFALVNQHPGRVDLVHVDFYRVKSPAELPELGLEEAYDQAATAIEWADRFPDWLPPDVLHIDIANATDGGRLLQIRSSGDRSRALLLGWLSASGAADVGSRPLGA
jgi:tRNA threonylcarbamoyladenosine biosynthesis protein TsaE